MKKSKKLIALSLVSSSLYANSLAYNGSSGLIETPNARISKDFSGSLFYSNSKPYSHFGASFSVLPQVEVNAHLSKVDGEKKDKVINLKLLLYPESDYIPALVYGLEDLWGDLNYASKYIAISKKISYFDFTLGYGVGRLGGSKNLDKYKGSSYKYLKNTSLKGGDIFAGVEFYASKNLRVLLEHSSIDYNLDKHKLKRKAKSKVNFGVNYDINKNISTKLSLNRGNQLSFALAYNFDLSNKEKNISFEDNKTYSRDINKNLADNNFSNIKLSENEDSLWINATNNSSYYDIDSLLKATNSVANSNDKDKYDYIYLDLERQNGKVLKVNVKEFEHYKQKDVSDTYMKKAVIIQNNKDDLYAEFSNNKNIKKHKKTNKQSFYYDITPKVRNYLVNDDKSLYTKASIDLNAKYILTDSFGIKGSISLPVFNNMDKLKRSDEYDKYDKIYLDKLYFSYGENFANENYLNIDAGILSQKYTGFNIEYQKSFLDDKVAISLQYQNVNKRKKDKIFKTKDENQDAKFVNLYYQLSKEKSTHLGLKVGEFLANDRGYRVELARTYRKFKFGAYFSRTKKDDKKYNTKGFYIKIPLSKKYFNNARKLAPVLFDSVSNNLTADFVDFDNSLYNRLSNENNLQIIKKNIYLLKK